MQRYSPGLRGPLRIPGSWDSVLGGITACLAFAYSSLTGFAIGHGWEWAQTETVPWSYPVLLPHILILVNILSYR